MQPLAQTITQVGIVVRDIDRALEAYSRLLGVGPWRVYTYAPPKLTETRLRGVPVAFSMKLALASRSCWMPCHLITESCCWSPSTRKASCCLRPQKTMRP